MPHLARRPSVLASLPSLLLAFAQQPLQKGRFHTDAELEPLATSLAAYFEARSADAGLAEAEAALAASLKPLEGDARAGEALSQIADLGRAYWLSQGYAKKDVKKGKVTTEVLRQGSFNGAGLEYAYRVPKDYDPKHAAYPLILALPDADEPPAQHIRSNWIDGELLDHAILLSPAMPKDAAGWESVMVQGRPGGLCHVLTLLRFATQQFALDPERVYVAGRGRSVATALATANYSPQAFAGIVGRTGELGELAPDNFGNLPTLFTATPTAERAAAFQSALKATGQDNCRIDKEDDERAVWSWMKEHPRRTYPESVTLVAGKPFPTRAYWLRIAPSAPEAQASATLDRGINAVRVSASGVSRVTLYLNDALLDLSRPVRVFVRGVEQNTTVVRRLPSALDMLQDGTSDASCVYVAQAIFDTAGDGTPASSAAESADAELDDRLKKAGLGADELWAVYDWCTSSGRAAQGERVLRRLLRVVPDHAAARAALGYQGKPGLWFPSAEAFARFQRSQTEAVAKAKGLVLEKSAWIHRDERVFAAKGWVKDPPTGQWLGPAEVRRLGEGWSRQDLEWIPPADARRVDDGQWLVDGEWVDLATANRRHADIDSPWRIPCREVVLHSTADREVALKAAEHMGRALEDLTKVFGAEPVLPLHVTLLRDEEQYDRFAFGDPDGRRRATDPSRLHVVHSAFFAESWFARAGGKLEFDGMGVCYWDPLEPNGDLFGVHAARLALGLSYVEALDPSPKAVRKALSVGAQDDYHDGYQAEKVMPAWLRYGGAVYAERFFFDATAAEGSDPWWARAWSRDNLEQRGGLRSLADVLAFRVNPDDRDDGLKYLLEAGFLVAFIVDGGCAPVTAAHAELKRGLAAGKLSKSQVDALVQALVANESALRAWK